MDVLVLIDKLDDTIHNAKPVPLTDQVRVDKEEIYDILDQMRATIPEEIKQARWIVKERQEMLAEAKREAERIVKEARERQERLISQEEVTKAAERAAEDIIEDATAHLDNVSVEPFDVLIVDFARSVGASAIVKGLRAISDFEYELEMNQLNRSLASDVESVYLMAGPQYSFLSSSGVKELATFDGNIDDLVPPGIAERLKEALRR